MAQNNDQQSASGQAAATGRTTRGATGRFVVLAAPAQALPGQLLSALARRGGEVAAISNAPGVMVELACRSADVLIIVQPERQPQVGELVAAVGHYHPQVDCWVFTSATAGKGRLARINGHGGAKTSDQPVAGTLAQPASGPTPPPTAKRAVVRKQSQRLRSLLVKVPAVNPVAGPRITHEELAMLLGPTPQELEEENAAFED